MGGEEVKVAGIEKFDSTDFEYWMMQIEVYLYKKRLYLPLGMKMDWNLLDR